jgi:transmembrane sensor
MNGPSIERTLYDLFAGRATPLQKKAVEEWLRTPTNQEVYYQVLARYEAEHAQYEPDAEAALTNFEAFMQGGTYPRHATTPVFTVVRSAGWTNARWLLSVAASVLLLLGFGYVTHDRWAYDRYEAPFGQTRTLSLPDGSEVTLNAHSQLRVPRFGFGNADREVWLTGEGYFSVRHTTHDHKFTVHTPNLDVRVLGTKFNVNTRSGQTEVILDEGKVQLIRPKTPAQPLTMKPGEQATLAEGDTAFRRKVVSSPDVVGAYRQQRLVFDGTPLSQVAERIQDYYGIRVVVGSRELARREFSGTLPNNDLNVVLRSLSVTYNLAVERQPGQVILKTQ